jgi:hypothetical protein
MSTCSNARGAAPVGFMSELDGVEAASVIYLRLWSTGEAGQTQVRRDFGAVMGPARGMRAARAFEDLFAMCTTCARRPLMRHTVSCACLGADEACFANFIVTAAEGAREDALLIATLLVRVDVAPLAAAMAMDVGLALKRMRLCSPRAVAGLSAKPAVLH